MIILAEALRFSLFVNTPHLPNDELLLLHQRSPLCPLLISLHHTAAQHLDLLHHPGGVLEVHGTEGQILQEDQVREPLCWLIGTPVKTHITPSKNKRNPTLLVKSPFNDQQGPEVVISEGVVKEVSQFKYLGSVLVTDGRLDVELNIRRGKAVGRFKQFEKMWGTKHLSLATKVKCYKAYVLPILLFGSECWSLTKVQSQKLERVHSSCLRSILGVRLSDRHTNEHIRKSCGVATLSAYITANRLRWLGHVGRMEEGMLPHIALFSSLHGDMTRPVGRPRHTWEKCVCADLKVLGQDEGSWEASCQIKSAWRKRLWDLTHPWESQRLVRCRRRTKQAIDKHVERYVMPFSGWEDGGSPVPRWWEPPPAPTRVVLDPAASPPPMCDGSGAGFGF